MCKCVFTPCSLKGRDKNLFLTLVLSPSKSLLLLPMLVPIWCYGAVCSVCCLCLMYSILSKAVCTMSKYT